MSQLRGIYIDPSGRKITEIQLEEEGLFDHLRKLCNCDMIQVVTRNNKKRSLSLYMDEEGRYHRKKHTSFAIRVDEMNDEGEEIIGPAVILGSADAEGNDTSAPDWCTVSAIQDIVMWADRSHAEFPDHWLVKTLIVDMGDGKLAFSCVYNNPYEFMKEFNKNPETANDRIREIYEKTEEAGFSGNHIFTFDQVGFDDEQAHEILDAVKAGKRVDTVTAAILAGVMENVRRKLAKDVLNIDEKNLFEMKEPVLPS